mmetsp:Transcript_10288/g.14539  ORF Transcript_10288/g.14539 Transcript_10288/m.14539 type:complete len:270 (+) Transcript_10288:104-913(+)
MSTAWYKPNVLPKLLRSFPRRLKDGTTQASVEVWNTTCIVTKFGKTVDPSCTVLINPSNPSLSGVKKFPYFPRGGPEPKEQPQKYEHHIMGYVSQWGGMEVGSGMLFAANVVDGLIHQLGGWKLTFHIKMLPYMNGTEKCPVGLAVATPPGGADLSQEYDNIVHTVPPFYDHHPEPRSYLGKCYKESLKLAEKNIVTDDRLRVACPLLGAGARGFPLEIALDVAAQECIQWKKNSKKNVTLAFGIPEISTAEKLVAAIESYEDIEDDVQ